jgi:hypothetical protein
MKRSVGSAGLSIMELLTALAILALIAAGLASAMGLGVRLFDRTAQLSENSAGATLRIRLRNLLAAATPPSLIAPFPVALEGRPNGFTFTTLSAPDLFPDAAALRVNVSGAGNTLVMTILALDDFAQEIGRMERTLATDTATVRFSYYGYGGDGLDWLHDWKDETRLPLLVRIEIDEGGSPDWPEFSVRLRLGYKTPDQGL